MLAQYIPDVVVDQVDPVWETILLSTRDVAQDLPINFKSTPGIVLTAACFSDGKYTASKSTCLSNLLAFGYRRILVDLYWLAESGQWSLCPTASGSTNVNDERGNKITCDDVLRNLDWLWSFWNDWIEKTEFNILAGVVMVVVNLYPEISGDGDGSGSGNGSKTPTPIWSASRLLPTSIYTPIELYSDRTDLNVTWLNGGDEGDDEARYFAVQTRKDGGLSSLDAWPSEGYLSFEKGKRLLLGFGEVKVQGFDINGDAEYFFGQGEIGWPYKMWEGGKGGCFFDSGKTSVNEVNNSWATVVDSERGRWTEKEILRAVECGFSTVMNSTTVSTLPSTTSNNSTNFTTITTSTSTPTESPIMEYFTLLKSTIWSWAPGQPAPPAYNMSETDIGMFRCTAMSTSDGRWSVRDCNELYRVACRVDDRPYLWTLGDRAGTYFDAIKLCPKRAMFDIPRSALENRYLFHVVNSTISSTGVSTRRKSPQGEEGLAKRGERLAKREELSSDKQYIWVDFQSLGNRGCWVRGGGGGAYTVCPYENEQDGDREVIVPTVAAVIVLVVAALMAFVKIGGARWERVRRKRRKEARRWGREGWEYEGVPA